MTPSNKITLGTPQAQLTKAPVTASADNTGIMVRSVNLDTTTPRTDATKKLMPQKTITNREVIVGNIVLPGDIVAQILGYLTLPNLLAIKGVCKGFKENIDNIWYQLKDKGIIAFEPLPKVTPPKFSFFHTLFFDETYLNLNVTKSTFVDCLQVNEQKKSVHQLFNENKVAPKNIVDTTKLEKLRPQLTNFKNNINVLLKVEKFATFFFILNIGFYLLNLENKSMGAALGNCFLITLLSAVLTESLFRQRYQ